MEMYKKKLYWLALLLSVYIAVSFWVSYSKLWFIEDIMQNQARLFFINQSLSRVHETLIEKAEALKIQIHDDSILVENINNEIIYIEMRWNEPVDILFYHVNLHFEPKIFGLIRGFDVGKAGLSEDQKINALIQFSDSTNRFLRDRNLRSYLKDFFE